MKKLKTPPSECYTLRTKTVLTRKDRQCFGCCKLFPSGCVFTIHTVIGIDEIYNMYLCEECEDISEQCSEDIYIEGELKRISERWMGK